MDTLTYYELMLLKLRRGSLGPDQEKALAQARTAMQEHAATVDAVAVAAAVDGFDRRLQGVSMNPLHDKSTKDV